MRSTFRPSVRPLALGDAPPSREERELWQAEIALEAARRTHADFLRRADLALTADQRDWWMGEADRYHGRVIAPLQARGRTLRAAVAEEGP